MSDPSDPSSYTVGWVCALSTEFTAAQEQFDEEYEPHESPEHREPNDFNVYSFGKIKGHMVVVAVMPNGQYGTASAATVAKDMIRSFRNIRFGLMVGIGGGAPTKQHDIRLGDVVVSSPTPGQSGVFQYDLGKATNEGFQHTASHNKPPPLLLAAVAGLKTQYERKGLHIHGKVSTIISNNKRLRAKYGRPEDPDSLFAACIRHKSDPCHEFCVTAPADLIDRTPRQEPMEDIEVHYGTIASGNTLMKDAAKRDELTSKESILCFETEAAGLMDGFRCLIIRGICDYCDSHKNDEWQGYAAMTAAVYAKQILGMIRPEAVTREETIASKIDEVISIVTNMERTEAENKVLDWLSDKDFGAHQFDERSKKAPGTCEWFLESPEYRLWTQKKSEVLFCPGRAGAGKTVLASAIIEDLHSRFQKESRTAISRIYCNYNRAEKQTFDGLRANLLRQLCESLSPLPKDIMKLHSEYKFRRFDVPPDRILEGLQSVSGQFSKIFMVVDALDEWSTDHGNHYSLPGELLFLQSQLAINLLSTSRPLPIIEEKFITYPSRQIIAQQQDIDAYIDNFRWPESSCVSKKPELRSMVKAIMPQVVLGMFLLAKLYLRSLENETSERDVKAALKRFEDRAKIHDSYHDFSMVNISDIVDEAYKDTMKRLRQQHEKHSDLAFRALAWICCTSWKLPVKAIQQGLALREGDESFDPAGIVDKTLLLSVCCGLVEIPKGSREIRLAHYTTEDFFQRNRPLIDQYFLSRNMPHCGLPSNADAYLARQCVTCLSISLQRQCQREVGSDPRHRTTFYDGYGRSLDPYQLHRDSPDHKVKRLLQDELRRNPLYEYAAFNWGGHMRQLPLLDQTYQTSINSFQGREMINVAVMIILTFGTWKEERQKFQDMSDLHLAALFGLCDLAESLTKKLDINSIDNGRTALVWALECLAFEFEFRPRNRLPDTPNCHIYDGIHGDRRCIVKALIRSGADPQKPGPDGNTPLHLAAILGDIEIVEILIDCGADTHASNKDGHTPIVLAVRYGKKSTYMKLLEFCAIDICGKRSCTALIEAASVGDLALVERLIEKGAKVDFPDASGKTALMEASKGGHTQIVKLLLENHSNVDHQDHRGGTALMNACIGNHAIVIDLLLAADAQLDIRNHSLETALYHGGHDDVVLGLLDAGVNMEDEDGGGIGPIHTAASIGTKVMVHCLIDKGISVNLRASEGRLPLDYAMRRKDKDTSIADFLRERGAITEAERLVKFMRNKRKRLDEDRV
ncbi:hypothetical protein FPRO04_09195 [Fusarium proliferatum]|nr:hypothetical protein FPRO03_09143 [Fusarium proliferatum]KAG4274528.1 hypothetical protein FPRO04_09195 [Fusarium proliferatum]